MHWDFDVAPMGARLGSEGFDQVVEQAHAVCRYERQRIELTNQSIIAAKKAEYAAELDRDEDIQRDIYLSKPPHEERGHRRRIVYCWTVGVILVVGGFVLSLLTLEPFQLGIKGLFYCISIAVVVPYLVEAILNHYASGRLVRVLVTVSGIVALVSLMTLAVIRGDLMGLRIQEEAPAVVIDGDDAEPAPASTSFYKDNIPLLKIVMVLLAFGTEVAAGIALHEAQRISENLGQDRHDLESQRALTREQLSRLAQEIIALGNEPALFEAKFWRDFHWTLLKRSIGRLTRGAALGALIFVGLLPAHASAEQSLDLVVLIDLSRSVSTTGPDQHSEFQKNIEAVSQLLKQVPTGSKVAIVGITDDSFGRPFVLLSASLGSDPGFFDEKLGAAHRQLQAAWQTRSHDLSPSFAGTDLLGALVVAGHIFDEHKSARGKVLVIFSDMWQESSDLNFGRAKNLCDRDASLIVHRANAPLSNVNVYALGVESSGHSRQEWACAHDFWVSYFAETGARLSRYTMLRDLQLGRVD